MEDKNLVENNSGSDDNNFKRAISSKRMKLVPSFGFVRRSSRAFKGKNEYCELSETEISETEVNFHKLSVNTLRKYKRFHNLSANVNISKPKLVSLVDSHFKKTPLSGSENEIITYFIHFVKTDESINHKDSNIKTKKH